MPGSRRENCFMKKESFEGLLKQMLEEQTKGIEASPYLLTRIKAEANRKRRKEKDSMKFFNTKRIVAAAVICLLSVTCYGALNFSGEAAHVKNNITSFADLEKAEKKLGFDAKYVECFANGFTFDRGGTGKTYGIDENGEKTGNEYHLMAIGYKNDAGKEVLLSIENGNRSVDSGQEMMDGYSVNVYKFVPPNYEKTEEDIAKEEAGELAISYGTDEIQINSMENYSWQDNGLYYSLTCADCDLGEEEMKKMAEEMKG